MTRDAVIVSTARTGIGRAYRGFFNDTEAPVLSDHVVRAAIQRSGIDPARIDDIFLGVGTQSGTQSYNLGRLTAATGGVPNAPGFALDRKCGSGLTAVALAARSIIADDIDVAVAGGVESISLTLNKHAMTYRNRSDAVIAAEPHAYMAMIETAEVVAQRYGISRAVQDEFAAQSQQRAAAAAREGRFADEITPIKVQKAILDKAGEQTGQEDVMVDRDEASTEDSRSPPALPRKWASGPSWRFRNCWSARGLKLRTSISGKSTRPSPARLSIAAISSALIPIG